LPELPDITIYIESLKARILGRCLERVRLGSPFVLRSVDPPLREADGRIVRGVERIGKRIVIGLDGELFLVIHLMIAGRLRWKEKGAKIPG
jgi:formamidopyrimidine-DNA glycosylase